MKPLITALLMHVIYRIRLARMPFLQKLENYYHNTDCTSLFLLMRISPPLNYFSAFIDQLIVSPPFPSP